MSASRRSSSTLLTTTITGDVAALQQLRDLRVLLGDAGRHVDDEQHEVGGADRASRLRAHLRRERRRLAGEPGFARRNQPPVSTSGTRARSTRPTSSRRSRVTPGRSSTIAARRPTMRLTSVDLPTFGRPTTATTGSSSLT